MADPTEEQYKEAARRALAAGDTAAAKRLVDAARRVAAIQPTAGPFSMGGAPQMAAGPFGVQAPSVPKWQQAPEVPKWQQAPEVQRGGMTTYEVQAQDGTTYEVQAPSATAAAEAVTGFSADTKPWEKYAAMDTRAGRAQTEVEMPDGTILEFPEGTDPATMKAATGKYWAQNQSQFTPEQQAAIDAAKARREGKQQGQFTPEQQAALDAARSRMSATNNAEPAKPKEPIYAAPRALPGASEMLRKPGDMTMDQALSSLSDTWQKGELQAPLSQGRAAIVGGAQGATFGFADEIVGGLLALHPRIDYDTARDYLRDEVDDAREYYPKTALAGEIGGSIAVPGKAAANFINKGKDTVGRMVRGALTGGTTGAVYGYGSGEGGAEERAWNALETGSLGALGGGALVGLGQGVNKLLGMVSKRPELKELAPTLEGLREQASRLYTEARESGALLPGSAVQDMVSGIQSKLRESGFDPDLHPRLKAVLNRLTSESGDKTLAEVEILRRVAGNAAESLAPDERRLASLVIDKIDDVIDGLPEGGEAMRSARETWGRLRRMELIDTSLERASLAKADFATALQSEFRALAKSARKLRGFSQAERAAIQSIAKGGPLTTGLQALGNALTPNRTLGALLAGGAAYNFGLGGVAVPAAGFAAKKIAEALSQRAGRSVRDNVGRSDEARRAIAELLRRPNPTAATAPAAGVLGGYLGGE